MTVYKHINKHNSRNTWNIINDLTKGNIKQNTLHINESNAGNFNEYFSQVGVNTYKQVTENYPPNELILDPQLETDLPNNKLFRPQPTHIPTII